MESSSQTPRVAPTVHTMIMKGASAETMIVVMSSVMKASASADVVERVTSLETVVYVAYIVLEEQRKHCSTRNMRSEELAGPGQVLTVALHSE